MINILMIGDVYGAVGRATFAEKLRTLKQETEIDLVVVNGENVTHGKSISRKHYNFLRENGADVITSGNHIFALREVREYIKEEERLLRPLNMNGYLPGRGSVVVNLKNKKVRVSNLMGQAFMPACNNPYEAFDQLLIHDDSDIHVVDYHAESTAEKIVFALNYDGVINAFAGTHTHVQTNDGRLLPKKTAFISDIGMTGVLDCAIGAKFEDVIIKEKYGYNQRFNPASGPAIFCAVLISVDEATNETVRIQTIRI